MTVRALVVDDSRTMRAAISRVLNADADIEVVGTAECANSARELIKLLDPDVVTLDVEMPGMDGLDFLERLMRLRPTPVVMLSTLTGRGADASIQALSLGAFDCVDKAVLGTPGETRLPQLVKTAARYRPRPPLPVAPASAAPADYRARANSMIAIGSSTGGVEALIALLRDFPATCPATVIVQHMPESFTQSFADRLDRLSAPTVTLARPGAVLSAGQVYLAPGGLRHLEIGGSGGKRHCRLIEGDRVNGHRPSVDRLFASVAHVAGADATGAILTGMGNDGEKGLKTMRDIGSTTFGQDEASCVVYGMPAEAKALGALTEQLPLSRIAGRLLKACAA